MKHLVTVCVLVIFTATGAYGMGTVPGGQTQPQTAGQPADIGPQDTLLHRPTPAPAASVSAQAAKVKKPLTATLGKDKTGKGSLATFATSDPAIYLVWKAETGTKGEKVHVAWYAVDTGGAIAKNKKLTEGTQTIPDNGSISGSSFIAKPASGFPAGTYRADLSDDGKVVVSLKFTIK